jgi:hypothetical protein
MLTAWQTLPESTDPIPRPSKLAQIQQQWLLQCLRRNKDSLYGRQHYFSRIDSVSEFQQQLPIVYHNDLLSYIEDMALGRRDCLFSGKTLAFERTSGSQSAFKLIPYSAASLQDFRRAILPWLRALVGQQKIRTGHAYWVISPATRQPETTAAGIPVGLPEAAYLGADLMPFFEEVSAVPAWVGEIADVDCWQLATLYFLVTCEDLRLVSVWSPTSLLLLLDALMLRKQELLDVLAKGIALHGQELPADQPAYIRLQQFSETHQYKKLWPELSLISCWGDASSKPFYREIKNRFDGVKVQAKGLLLTEGVVTIPDAKDNTLLAAESGFFEFIDRDNDLKLAHELKPGQTYELIMTTSGGLYRYRTADLVCCDGHCASVPILRFIGRESASDLVGEKITEAFAGACLKDISGFSMLLPLNDSTPRYVLMLSKHSVAKSLVDRVEARLCENPQYAHALKLGQLQPLAAIAIDNPMQVYLNSPQHGKARLGDIKIPSLCLKPSIFDAYIRTAV